MAPREVHARVPVGLGGDERVADRNAADRRTRGEEAQRRLAGRDAKHFDRQCADQRAADVRDQRDAADHAVRGVCRDEPPAGRGGVDRVDAAERAGEVLDVQRARPCGPGRILHDERRRSQRHAGRLGHPGDGEHRRSRGHRSRKQRVVRRERGEFAGPCGRLRAGIAQQSLRRQRIGLGHQDVDPHDGRLHRRHPCHEFGEGRARPRPAPERGEALRVDLDDDGRHRADDAWRGPLVAVEPRLAQRFVPARRPGDQQRQRDDERGAREADAAGTRRGRCRGRVRRQSAMSSPS